MFEKRITILLGYSGSGKTRIAVAGASALLRARQPVALVDLDLATPSLHQPDLRRSLELRGATVLAKEWDPLKEDASLLMARTRRLLEAGTLKMVLDVGSDAVSLTGVRKLADRIPEAESDRLFVVNFHRPFTEDAVEARQMAERLASSAGLRLSGVVCNTHLMQETTPETVIAGYRQAEELARALEVRLAAVTVTAPFMAQLGSDPLGCPVVGLGEEAIDAMGRLQPSAARQGGSPQPRSAEERVASEHAAEQPRLASGGRRRN